MRLYHLAHDPVFHASSATGICAGTPKAVVTPSETKSHSRWTFVSHHQSVADLRQLPWASSVLERFNAAINSGDWTTAGSGVPTSGPSGSKVSTIGLVIPVIGP